jgi:phosphoribosyl-AMP cyclohydrolase
MVLDFPRQENGALACLFRPRANTVQSTIGLSPLISVLKWNPEGLIPAVVQDAESGAVLMMAWMDQSALTKTLEIGQTHFYSRSRRSPWHKGETSGHVQIVQSMHVDCDADVLLIQVRQQGGACHQGYRSCFFRRVNEAQELEIADTPVFDTETVYGPAPEADTGIARTQETR